MENYRDIELTEEELVEILLAAKRKKKADIAAAEEKKRREEAARMKAMKWDMTLFRSYLYNRSKTLFGTKEEEGGEIVSRFVVDDDNEKIFTILCYYFLDDEASFARTATSIGVSNPSLKKGILLPGNFGCGKTWMMKLLSRNKKLSYEMVSAKDICRAFMQATDKQIPEVFLKPWDTDDEDAKRWFSKDEVFHQRYIGLCIDDLGSEPEKNNFGNKMNVIGDIIESRYSSGFTGPLLHGTTNLSAEELKEFYGERVISRMREIFNFIELPGTDRRK